MSQAGHTGSSGTICCTLPPEMIGLIFSHLDDEERCRIIPPVSEEFYHIHSEYPPPTKRWRIDWFHEGAISQAMVKWCSLIAPSLEVLEVDLGSKRPGLMPQMLMAASGAGSLRSVSISNVWKASGALLGALTALTCLTKLTWEAWEMPAGEEEHGIHLLSRLRSLQEIHLDSSMLRVATANQGDALWQSLATLRNLNLVALHVTDDYEDEPVGQLCPRLFLQSLSLMTNISALLLYNIDDCLEADGLLPASLCTLTQLTGLTLFGGLSSHNVRDAVSLPRLRELSLMLYDLETDPVALQFCSDSLTTLRLSAKGPGLACTVERLLRPSGPFSFALHRLRHLDLSFCCLDSVSEALAGSLSKLTHISMKGNQFVKVPPGMIRMKALHSIDFRFNYNLNFVANDLKVFTALQQLRRMELDELIVSRNAGILNDLLQKLPHLDLYAQSKSSIL